MRRLPLAALVAALLSVAANAEPLRVATFNTELSRDGPGLLLRDIRAGKDPQVAAVVAVIAAVRPDILALQGIDWDFDGAALSALAGRLAQAGAPYPHRVSLRPNSGMETGLDLNGDGRTGGPEDAQGYGRFTGQGGIAVLSRFPIDAGAVKDFSARLWRDFPGATLPAHPDGTAFPSNEALAVQRLSSTAHWAVPIRLPDGTELTLLTFQAAPPVFDGPEDRNGRRNADEIRFWQLYLDGAFGPAPRSRFVIAGGANLDPQLGEGRHDAIRALLADRRLTDPAPQGPGAAILDRAQPATPHRPEATVDWPGVGRLRVDYVLPSRDWRLAGAGVYWPAPGEPGHATALAASRHRLVWVDVTPE